MKSLLKYFTLEEYKLTMIVDDALIDSMSLHGVIVQMTPAMCTCTIRRV